MNQFELNELAEKYRYALIQIDKPACVRIVIDALESGLIKVVSLYEDILAPVLNQVCDSEFGQPGAIWREHARSEITRTVIECCYPYVLKLADSRRTSQSIQVNKTNSNHRVIIVLPHLELHELGARMGADFFQIIGFETLFIGSNTPQESILNSIAEFSPDYIVIHVVNYYNLFQAKQLLIRIRQNYPDVKILVSGSAFYERIENLEPFGPVCLVRSFKDIESLLEE